MNEADYPRPQCSGFAQSVGVLRVAAAGRTRRTSQACPCCGHVAKESRKTQALFACLLRGHTSNVDHVGAIDVL
ncbi:zinc ribbon domain-containing protein [Caballeronia sp.]|uniref:zinc ribbon domain-containing protein n=1 Tax=Caballeronia sp. TaxID=1931223 RepID=UPI003C565E47